MSKGNNQQSLEAAVADTIMKDFIPADRNATEFSFNFTIPAAGNFLAHYEKDSKGKWTLKEVISAG